MKSLLGAVVAFVGILLAGCHESCQREYAGHVAQLMELLSQQSHSVQEVDSIRMQMRQLCDRCGNSDIRVVVPMLGTFDRFDLAIFADDQQLASRIMKEWNHDQICEFKGSPGGLDARINRASRWGTTSMISLVARYGCPLVGVSPSNVTPLHASIGGVQLNGENSQKVIELGAPLDALDADGTTALDCAIIRGNVRMVELLLTHGAKVRPKGVGDTHTLELVAELGSVTLKQKIAKADIDQAH